MKCILISPPFSNVYGSFKAILKYGFLNPPLGLCYLAASLKRAGHQPLVLDCEAQGYNVAKILEIVQREKPDLIGITATSPEFYNAVAIAEALKSHLNIPIVLGGVHLTIFRQKVLVDYPCFDFGVIGEGEETIVELLENLPEPWRYSQIRGLIFRAEGEVIENPLRPLHNHLDNLPFPDRTLLDNRLYFRNVPRLGHQVTTAFMSSRGCPFNCIYCAVAQIPGGRQIRYRSAPNVADEIEYVVRELNVPHISFNDDVLTMNKARIYELCEEIQRRGLRFTWEGLSRADRVDRKLLQTMKASGFVRISYGIESGNPEILKFTGKNETLEQISEAFRITREAGILARGSLIIGLPYENRRTVEDSFRFINSLYGLDQVVINILQPYPGTKVREMILRGEGGSRIIADDLRELRRFGNASVEVNDLSRHRLIWLQKIGLLRFYLRPGILWRNFKLYQPQAFLLDGLAFFRALFSWGAA
ncbi:MAG: radical SAM protein [Deltaproteobacteria bacterium]|nr:radical SAM protein [Deltaproteobacteria bacterium]MBW1952360.1 radical SAM protein [Deltaproteobacteria bacterium]MBW1986472.1 radical SAM protein [Deltaproteobacteria bacterium]MBW2135446.1 radical SAM protein [Deltaproteobacteria bacterium]